MSAACLHVVVHDQRHGGAHLERVEVVRRRRGRGPRSGRRGRSPGARGRRTAPASRRRSRRPAPRSSAPRRRGRSGSGRAPGAAWTSAACPGRCRPGRAAGSAGPGAVTRSPRATMSRTIATYSRVRASGLANGWPYQPSTTCGPDTPRPEDEAPAGEVVHRHRGHRGGGRGAGGHLHDRRAQLHVLGRRAPPGQRREHVGAVRLGGPDRVEAQLVGLGDRLLRRRAAGPRSSSRCSGRASRSRAMRRDPIPPTQPCSSTSNVSSGAPDRRHRRAHRLGVGRVGQQEAAAARAHHRHPAGAGLERRRAQALEPRGGDVRQPPLFSSHCSVISAATRSRSPSSSAVRRGARQLLGAQQVVEQLGVAGERPLHLVRPGSRTPTGSGR